MFKPLNDLIHQQMFRTTKRGYNPRQVDAFMEQLKDQCRELEENYRSLVEELDQLRQEKAAANHNSSDAERS